MKYTLVTIGFSLFFASQVVSQHCCLDLEFSPDHVDLSENCDAAATEIHGGVEAVALVRGARIIKGANGLYSADVLGFACIHELDLGDDLTSSTMYLTEIDKWTITIGSRLANGSEDSLTFGDGFLRIHRK